MPRIRILLHLTSPLLLLLPTSTSAFSFPANPRRPITPPSVPLLRATSSSSPSSSFSSSSSSSSSSYADRLSRIPVVICPGFGNDSIDYVSPLGRGSEYGLVSALSRRGFNPDLIRVLPLDRIEWLRVAGGLFDVPNFYRGTCRPTGLGYGWYVRRLRETIQGAHDDAAAAAAAKGGGGGERVLLIGHSAGGWLARAALGDGSWDDVAAPAAVVVGVGVGDYDPAAGPAAPARASDRVRALITIGAIHSPPRGGPSSCVTRGALAYVDENYPGAYHAGEGIAYVSVGGDAVVGRRGGGREEGGRRGEEEESGGGGGTREANEVYEVRGEGSSASSVAYASYKAVGGDGETTGDGVVPLEYALLEGSRTIVLEGVVHSINEAGTTLPTDGWYGAEGVVDRWLYDALEEAGIVVVSEGRGGVGGAWDGLFSLDRFADIFNSTLFKN